jgi:hypothetical protein
MIEAFKYYKRKDKPVDFAGVIDCSEKDDDEVGNNKLILKK